MKHEIAFTAANIAAGYMLYVVYEAVMADGSWYNNLYMEKGRDNVSRRDKFFEIVRGDGRSIDFFWSVSVLVAIYVGTYVLARVLVAGIVNF